MCSDPNDVVARASDEFHCLLFLWFQEPRNVFLGVIELAVDLCIPAIAARNMSWRSARSFICIMTHEAADWQRAPPECARSGSRRRSTRADALCRSVSAWKAHVAVLEACLVVAHGPVQVAQPLTEPLAHMALEVCLRAQEESCTQAALKYVI